MVIVTSKYLVSANNSIYRMAGSLDTGFGYIQKFINGAWEIYEGELPDDVKNLFPLKDEDFFPQHTAIVEG